MMEKKKIENKLCLAIVNFPLGPDIQMHEGIDTYVDQMCRWVARASWTFVMLRDHLSAANEHVNFDLHAR